MKIAMIGHKRIPSREGGVEIVVEALSRRMVQRGHRVTVYNRKSRHVAGTAFDDHSHLHNLDGVQIRWVPTPNSKKLNAIVYSFFATVRALFGGYDIIHFHAEGPAAMVPLAKCFGKKCVVTIHGLDWQRAKWGGFATRFLRFGERMAAKYADEIIVLSASMQQYFADTYHRQTVRIENGIDPPETADLTPLSRFGLEKDSYILFLGRIVPEKGIHYLIDAYHRLQTDKAGNRRWCQPLRGIFQSVESQGCRRCAYRLYGLCAGCTSGCAVRRCLSLLPALGLRGYAHQSAGGHELRQLLRHLGHTRVHGSMR